MKIVTSMHYKQSYKDYILKYLVTCDSVLPPLGIGRISIYSIHLNKTHIATRTNTNKFVLLNIKMLQFEIKNCF